MCFGNKLTMLRYPELEIIDVDANKVYYEHKKISLIRHKKAKLEVGFSF